LAYEHREGSGSLFKNDKREKDSQPNARGDALVGGILYEIAAWTKTDKNGNKWQSLSFKPKEDRQPAPKQAPAKAQSNSMADLESDLPF
jgi:hypothetical protein